MSSPALTRAVSWALRLSLSSAFLFAVADRFGLCGPPGAANVAWGAWQPFVEYTGTLLFYLPQAAVQAAAWVATVAEIVLGVWLLTGWQTRLAAYGSMLLLLGFGVSMVLALGVKAPMNYSVFTAAAAAFALAALNSQDGKSMKER
ncbi:MAG: DoxX family protein [Verrucomicrobiota bacterium]